jgi:hypothetical protein
MKLVPTDKPATKINLGIADASTAWLMHKEAPAPFSRTVVLAEGKVVEDVASAVVNEDESISLLGSDGNPVGTVASC